MKPDGKPNRHREGWDAQTEYHYNESQIHLMQFQRRTGVIPRDLRYTVYAKAFEMLATGNIQGLQEEVKRMIDEQTKEAEGRG